MGMSRRGFFKLTGAALMTSVIYEFSAQSPAMALGPVQGWKLVDVKETSTICCYCAGGCGTIV
ncbi:MAG TPA: hypothetical protein VIL06_06815, partial [Coriobacteriia bacterium]